MSQKYGRVPRGGRVIQKEIKLKYVWIILKLPYPSIGQCPSEYPIPLINQKQISDFGQSYRFWSRGWVAYTTPSGGGIGQTTLCQNLGNLIFQCWNDENPRIDSARVTYLIFQSWNDEKPKIHSARAQQYKLTVIVVWLRSSGWSAQSPRAVHRLLGSLKPIFYLCNNQALLKAVKRWVGEGGKAALVLLVGALDAEILREAIEELRKRTTAGAATFLFKVTAQGGETVNEEADIRANKAISSKDVPMEMARQDKSRSLHVAKASLEKRYGELWRLKIDVKQRGAEGGQTRISRRGGAQASESCDRRLETN